MSPQRHVIFRQTLELVITSDTEAWPLQQEASRIMRKTRPMVERYCDELSSPDRLHRIECLELDLGVLDSSRLEEELLAKFSEALRQGLAALVKLQESSGHSPAAASQLELFAQFVRHGNLPWWADITQTSLVDESLDRLLHDAPGLLRQLLPELARDPLALRRLVGHFDDRRLAALVFLMAPALADFPLALFQALLSVPTHLPALAAAPLSPYRNHLWQSILGNAALSAQPPSDLFNFSREVTMRLARLQAIAYPVLIQGFTQAAIADRLQGTIQAIAEALEAECSSSSRLNQPDPLAVIMPEELRQMLSARLWGDESAAEAWAELCVWLENGAQGQPPNGLQSWPAMLMLAINALFNSPVTNGNPVPPFEKGGLGGIFKSSFTPQIPPSPPFSKGGAQDRNRSINMRDETTAKPTEPQSSITSIAESWPNALREKLSARLREMGVSGEALTELWLWLKSGAPGQPPNGLQSWPAMLILAINELFNSPVTNGNRVPPFEKGGLGGIFKTSVTHQIPPSLPFSKGGAQDADGLSTTALPQRHWDEALAQSNFSDTDEIYLGNAGLVILWPFLGAFFGRLGLLEKNHFIDETRQLRAVALLQYLASEDTAPPEYLLPLNKVLCGMSQESVFEFDTPLTEEEIAECNALLEAVIAQAPILNKMSIQGFRGSYLLRAGILGVRDGAWLLRVERETYDLVLDRFPWGFAWVRLPWMEAPLQVEW